MTWRYYQFCGHLEVAIREQGLPNILKYQLEPYRIEKPRQLILELKIGRYVSDLESQDETFSGIYKGVPWRMYLSRHRGAQPAQVSFYCPFFSSFLVPRMILVPYLKKYLADEGCFSLIGSAFRYRDRRYVLFGFPGCGKTRVLLEAAEKGAEFMGDSELVVTHDGSVRGLFNHIEFRYGSVADTGYWPLLMREERYRLLLCHGISVMTQRRVSFNILVDPEKIKLKPTHDFKSGPVFFIYLEAGVEKKQATVYEMVHAIGRYEEAYRRRFGDIFFNQQHFARTIGSMNQFLPNCHLWKLPAGSSLNEILNLDSVMAGKNA